VDGTEQFIVASDGTPERKGLQAFSNLRNHVRAGLSINLVVQL
jgi:hypothetical protein